VLISRRPDHLQLITHGEHARVAEVLCSHWGNERFGVPAPRDALLLAAAHHDDGWAELDGAPSWNSQAHRPAHFLELPLEVTVGPYGRGVDSVYGLHPLAGALVSMHWAGLYSRRWGLQAGDPVELPLARQVVAEQEPRWAAALREAWGYEGPRSEFEAGAWHAYEVLQALDFISLALCLLDVERPAAGDGEALPMPGTLWQVDQPEGARIVPMVPEHEGGPYVDMRLWVDRPGRVCLDPYPFSSPEFEVELNAAALEDRPFGSASDASAAYRESPRAAISVMIAAAV
jgi:hypothetical protein